MPVTKRLAKADLEQLTPIGWKAKRTSDDWPLAEVVQEPNGKHRWVSYLNDGAGPIVMHWADTFDDAADEAIKYFNGDKVADPLNENGPRVRNNP